MRTTAVLSTVGEDDCCAVTGTPADRDVMAHTPVTTSDLLIHFVICAHLIRKAAPNTISWRARHRLRLKGDTMEEAQC